MKNDDIVIGPEQGTPLWHSIRGKLIPNRPDGLPDLVITATKAAAACNMSQYSGKLDLFNQYIGLQPPWKPSEGDLRPYLGIRCEPIVLEAASAQLPQTFPELMDKVDSLGNLTIRTGLPLMWRSSNPLIGASLDGLLDDNTPVDAKTTWSPFQNKFGESGTDDIPIDYLFQGQQQMFVVEAEYCYFPVLFGFGGVLKCYRVPRNETLIDGIITAETELVERVRNNDPPEPNWELPSVVDAVRKLHPKSSGEIIDAPPELAENWEAITKIKRIISELKKEVDKRTAQAMLQVGDADTARTEDQEIYRVEQPELVYTEDDVDKLKAKVGSVKRKPYWFLKSRVIKTEKKGIVNVKTEDNVVRIGHTSE